MKILFLGPPDSPIAAYLSERSATVVAKEDRLDPQWVRDGAFDFLVSYGYRHILKSEILSLFPSGAINLHISLLPWNRGADPNFWSFVEHTPKGVTIHYIDEGVDTGDVIAQAQVTFGEDETLASSYAKLRAAIENLFYENWEAIQLGTNPRIPQTGTGSTHRASDKIALLYLLNEDWNTPVQRLIEFGKINGRRPIPARPQPTI